MLCSSEIVGHISHLIIRLFSIYLPAIFSSRFLQVQLLQLFDLNSSSLSVSSQSMQLCPLSFFFDSIFLGHPARKYTISPYSKPGLRK